MKIAFLEYYQKERNTGDFNFMKAWYDLLNRRHRVDWVQVCDIDEDTIIDAKTIHQVDINSYDLVIVCDLYESRKRYLKENTFYGFLDYLKSSVMVKKVFMCHQRTFPAEQNNTDFIRMQELAEVCDIVLTYTPGFFEQRISKYRKNPDLVFKITFDLFYKPLETKRTFLNRPIDLVYLNNLVPWKNPVDFLDLYSELKSQYKLFKTSMYGYYPGLNPKDMTNYNNVIRNDERVSYCNGTGSSNGKIELHNRIETRQNIGYVYGQSKFSWQFTAPRVKVLDYEKPWGLEGSALESIMYGCIPIVPKLSKNYFVYDKPLVDYNCCVFIDGPKDIQSIIDAQLNYNVLYENCRKFTDKLLLDSNRYINNITKILQEIKQQ